MFTGNIYTGRTWLSDIFFNAVMMFLEKDSFGYFQELQELFYKNFSKLHNDISYNIGAILTTYLVLSKPALAKIIFRRSLIYYIFF
ncbi:MAG: hypothetical protein IPL67_06695 [Ignavibacteria bacterium]|nr:hypothetical protein [Ignavibacteria bacterium]